MLLLQLFEGKVSRGFVITHVIVPCLREFEELRLLGSFDVLQFLLLRGADIVFLTYGFFPQKLVKLSACFLCFLIVPFDFAFLSILLQEAKEV